MAASSSVLSRAMVGRDGRRRDQRSLEKWRSHQLPVRREVRSASKPMVKCHVSSAKPATYCYGISTDIPLYESPEAMFDEYLEDKSRVYQAMFPDKHRSLRLNEEEWRIQMLPINFLLITVWPVVDMRLMCKSCGRDYPPDVPRDISKLLELHMMRWELQGLEHVMEPSHFELGVKGELYADRRGTDARLRGRLEMTISFVPPPLLQLVPVDVRSNVANAVKTLLDTKPLSNLFR